MKQRKIALLIFGMLLLCSLLVLAACNKVNNDNPSEILYPSYTVIFDNGNEENVKLQSDTATGKVGRPHTPMRTGYTFEGWYVSSDYKTLYDFENIVDHQFTLYGKWVKNKNKIIFKGNGSTSGSMDEVQAESESIIKLPKNKFEKVGYTFIGWSDVADGTVKNLDSGWFYMENLPTVVLYAVWKANEYPVILDAQGVYSDALEVTSTYDSCLPSINKPTKAGYVFAGYYTLEDGKGDGYYDSEMSGIKPYCITGSITLYAYWVAAVNTLVFVGNGSTSGTTEAINTETLAEVKLPDSGFIRNGYTFCGWNTRSDGNGKTYEAGENYVVPADAETVSLYAVWEPNCYSVIFDNNFSNEQVSESHTYDFAKTLLLNSFSRYGYDFIGWNDGKNGEGNFYRDGQEVINLTAEANGQVRLYAVWTPVTVTVTFDKDGGIGGTNYTNITYGSNFPKAVAPSKAGYNFGGYYKSKNGAGTQFYDAEMNVLAESDIGENNSIYANWIAKSNELVLYPNGGKGTVVRVNTKTDAFVYLGNYTFEKTGYTLAGWSNITTAGDLSVINNAEYKIPASDTEVPLYAVWKPNALKVSFNGNNSTVGATNTINGVCDGIITLPDSGFERTGYKFAGWSLSANGGQVYLSNSNLKLPAVDAESIELYAQWELVNYAIKYELEGGTNSLNNPNNYNYLSAKITLQNPSRLGYNFKGWSQGNTIPANSTGDKTFTATWELINYDIHYVLNATGVKNNNVNSYTVLDEIELENPVHSTKKFEGWVEGNTIPKGSTGDKTFTAQWDDPTYSITYILDGGQNGIGNPGSYTAESPTITFVAPTKNGFSFAGWTCAELGIVSPANTITIPKGSTGDKTFTAHWIIITYKINYVLNGGTNSAENPDSYNVYSGDILLEDPVRNGYTFDGWQEGVIIEEGSVGDLTFTAVWTAIRYDINIFDGVNEEPKVINYTIESEDIVISIGADTENGAEYSYTVGNVLKTVSINHRGYHLLGWYEGSDDTLSNPIITVSSGTTGNKYFVSKWQIIEYSITYDLDGGVINEGDNPENYTVESGGVVLVHPTRTGYNFTGWENGGGGIIYVIPDASVGDISLRATWAAIEYTITYDLGDETAVNDSGNPDKYTIEDEEIIFGAPSREGYIFKGWEDNTGNSVTSIPQGSTGNKTLIAKWELDISIDQA